MKSLVCKGMTDYKNVTHYDESISLSIFIYTLNNPNMRSPL